MTSIADFGPPVVARSARVRTVSHLALKGGMVLLLVGCLGDVPGTGITDRDRPSRKDPPPTWQPVDPQFAGTAVSVSSPLRVEFTGTGWLLVTDSRQRMVFRVDTATMRPDQALAIDGKPLAVGMLGDQIFVGIEEQRSVAVYDSHGAAVGFLGGAGAVAHPSDIAIDPVEGWVFVLDGRAGDIKVFEAAGRILVGTIASGQLLSPAGVAVDRTRREVLVSDYGSVGTDASVKFFSYATEEFGAFTGEISGGGTCGMSGCAGGFSRPRGLAVDSAHVYVVDAVLAQVLVYERSSGQLTGTFGTGDPVVSDLRVPTDVETDGAGRLYVSSTRTSRIVAFRTDGGP